MKPAMTAKTMLLTAFTAFTVVGLGTAAIVEGPAVLATSIKADYSLSASPSTQTIQVGDVATYMVSVSPLNNFGGTVTLTASKPPGGATACFTVSCMPTGTINTSGSIALLVKNEPVTPKNGVTITVNATAGSPPIKHSVDVTLVVNKAATYALSLTPSYFLVDPGSTATYTVVVDRSGGFGGSVSLSVSGLPKNATGTFSNTTVSSSDANPTLTVQTEPKTPAGSYTITVTGKSTQPDQVAQATLDISSRKWIPFVISGDVSDLSPGNQASPINLNIYNPNKTTISVNSLSVSLGSVANTSCPSSSFAVTQYTGPLPLAIPAGGTIHLSDSALAIGQQYWPTVALLDDPTDPQDGCLNTSVALSYTGTGTAS